LKEFPSIGMYTSSFDICEHCIKTICNVDKYYREYRLTYVRHDYCKFPAFINQGTYEYYVCCNLCLVKNVERCPERFVKCVYYKCKQTGKVIQLDSATLESYYDENDFDALNNKLILLQAYCFFMSEIELSFDLMFHSCTPSEIYELYVRKRNFIELIYIIMFETVNLNKNIIDIIISYI